MSDLISKKLLMKELEKKSVKDSVNNLSTTYTMKELAYIIHTLQTPMLPCPICGKDVVVRKTKKGRRYYGCAANPECDFMAWQKPSGKKCPQCGGVLLEKGNKLACASEECGHVEMSEKK